MGVRDLFSSADRQVDLDLSLVLGVQETTELKGGGIGAQ